MVPRYAEIIFSRDGRIFLGDSATHSSGCLRKILDGFSTQDEMDYIRDSNTEMYTVGFADGIEWSEDDPTSDQRED